MGPMGTPHDASKTQLFSIIFSMRFLIDLCSLLARFSTPTWVPKPLPIYPSETHATSISLRLLSVIHAPPFSIRPPQWILPPNPPFPGPPKSIFFLSRFSMRLEIDFSRSWLDFPPQLASQNQPKSIKKTMPRGNLSWASIFY